MKRGSGFRAGRVTVVAVAAVALALAGCATSAPLQTFQPEPAACADPLLVEMKAEQPDSLSEREWQRLHVLEPDCGLARREAPREARGWTPGHHVWWMGSGVAMVFMMLAMSGAR